jgi:hypothetical protein
VSSNLRTLLALIAGLSLLAAGANAYTGGLDSGTAQITQCNDGQDNDYDGKEDGNDPGCAQPYYQDDSERNVIDLDLTATMADSLPPNLYTDESIFFNSSLRLGSELNPDRELDKTPGTAMKERYITDPGGTNDALGDGQNATVEYDIGDMAAGTVFAEVASSNDNTDNRAIGPPNLIHNSLNCGDGIQNENRWQDCLADFGNRSIKTSYPSNINGADAQTVQCRDDDSLSKTSPTCGSCGCGSAGSVRFDTNSYSQDRGNYYWTTKDTQNLKRMNCDEISSSTKSTSSISCGDGEEDVSGPDSPPSYVCTGLQDCYGGKSETRYDREFQDSGTTYNCNKDNAVYGGGENSADDVATNKPDNDAAATFVNHRARTLGKPDRDYCGIESHLTVDADGARGQGDGFAVLHRPTGSSPYEVVSTWGPGGGTTVGQTVLVDGAYTAQDFTPLIENSLSCPGEKNTCLVYADYYTKPTDGGDSSWSVSEAVQLDVSESSVYAPSASLSVCRKIQQINEKNGDGSELIECQTDSGGGGGGAGSGGGSSSEVCEDEPGEYYIYMEGPEVDTSGQMFNNHAGYYQDCVDTNEDTGKFGGDLDKNACVVRGEAVAEGTVVNVAPDPKNIGFEEGGNSPDWEVCLDLGDIGNDGDDELAGDNKNDNIDKEDYGGELYDLDSELVANYLNSAEGSDLIGGTGFSEDTSRDMVYDSNGDGTGDERDIDYYLRKNQAPYHSEYNPGGYSGGSRNNTFVVEDDCGPGVSGCSDESRTTNSDGTAKNPLFFSFIEESKRDEDYNPQGEDNEGDESVSSSFYNGYVVKTNDFSDQLQADGSVGGGMVATEPSPSSASRWENSSATNQSADRYAIASSLDVSVSNRGRVFSPGSVYYHKDFSGTRRTSRDQNSGDIRDRAFANSFAAVSAKSLNSDSGNDQIPQDRGVWIDPDYLKDGYGSDFKVPTSSSWEQELSFKMDLTGPDSGLGFDVPSNMNPVYSNSQGSVVRSDILWEGETDNSIAYGLNNQEDRVGPSGPSTDNTDGPLEPPMCGDDQSEYLIEEGGESPNSELFNGPYACVSKKDLCYSSEASSENKFVDSGPGNYRNASEPEEPLNRFKSDRELCIQRTSDAQSVFWDQDYGPVQTENDGIINTCNTNKLYGDPGIRWFPQEYVKFHPFAVNGGIDDDYNDFLQQQGHETFTSKSSFSTWDSSDNTTKTPVPTGSDDSVVATQGICGGDDGSEYLATQVCQTDVCVTDRSHFGVGKNPGSCVFDGRADEVGNNAQPTNTTRHRRQIYDPGQSIQLDFRQPVNITCVGGEWFEQGPIVFDRENITVPVGERSSAAFSVINTVVLPAEFRVQIDRDTTAERFSQFDTKTGTFTIEVPPKDRKQYELNIEPTREFESSVTVRATGTNSDKSGSDTLEVEATENKGTSTGSRQYNEERNVPGITALQLIAISVAALTYILWQDL